MNNTQSKNIRYSLKRVKAGIRHEKALK